jgi:hypothetical protein
MMLRARMPESLAQLRGVVTDDPNPWLLLAAAAVVVVLLIVLLWPRFRAGGNASQSGSYSSPAATEPSLAQQRAVERDMQTLMRELSEMARKIGTQLDAKSARLEALIRAADERVARLESFSYGGGARSTTNDTPADDNDGHTSKPLPPDIVLPPPSNAVAATAPHEPDPRHAQIYALADQGLSAVQIAERLGYNEGEIELIVALRPPRSRRAGAGV